MSKNIPVMIGLALALLAVAYRWESREQTLQGFENRNPVVSFEVHTANRAGILQLPQQLDLSNRKLDAEGVPKIWVNGVEFVHIADITAQASGLSNNDLNLEAALEKAPDVTPQQRIALDWLAGHQVALEKEAAVWHYTFPHAFNDLKITSPWPSAFAQADVIKALLLAYARTGERRYLDLALRAGYAFTVPCERGGLRCEVGGVPWFEEVPVPNGFAPMILNGHLYSVVMLHRLWKATGDERIRTAFDEGFQSAREMLLHYDTGYWSEYQLRPRAIDINFRVDPVGLPIELREVTVRSAITKPSSIVFGTKGSRTYHTSSFGGEVVGSTTTGVLATGPVTIILAPGPFSVQSDLAVFSGFEATIRFGAHDCAHVRFGTFDWRSTSSDGMAIPKMVAGPHGDECVASSKLPNSINQWSQVTPLYHDWHTRLVTELWRISGDAKFYTTVIRWRRYAEDEIRHRGAESKSILEPVFDPQDSTADDEIIYKALGGVSPANISAEEVRTALAQWFQSAGIREESRRTMLLARAGLR
jgi:hypothetical protein